jgi:hypothetical protein
MKKIHPIFQLILFTGLLAIAGGCSETVEPKPLTYSQLLSGTTSKTWRLTGIQLIEENAPPVSFDLRSILDECESDDLYVFYADKDRKFEIQEGATKCAPEDPDLLLEDTWSIVNATATINFFFPVLGADAYTLKSLTENTFTIEYYIPDLNFSYRFIFTAQRGG